MLYMFYKCSKLYYYSGHAACNKEKKPKSEDFNLCIAADEKKTWFEIN